MRLALMAKPTGNRHNPTNAGKAHNMPETLILTCCEREFLPGWKPFDCSRLALGKRDLIGSNNGCVNA